MYIPRARTWREMELLIRPGERRRSVDVRSARGGYTLIELIVVMAIISVLVSIAVPLYQKSITRTKESVLKNNLFTLRTVIDEYTFDKKKAPQTLQDLVTEGYLRQVPIDPITGSDRSGGWSWKIAFPWWTRRSPGSSTCTAARIRRAWKGPPYSQW